MSPSKKTPPRSADESLLDAQSKAILDAIGAADTPHYTSLTPAELRKGHEDFFFPLSLQERDLVRVDKIVIDGPDGDLRLWVYRPKSQPKNTEETILPVCLFYHGGGLMVGSLELYDSICQRLCIKSNTILISVDYRLAPEHKYPAAHDDCYAALLWAAQNAHSFGGDINKIAVSGDSGGGLLAAAMTRRTIEKNGPNIRFQMLIYPALGKRREYDSYKEFSSGYFGEPEQLNWFYSQYLASPEQINDIAVSPILADDFSGLPPAFILTAGYDILRDEAEHYAQLLKKAGVPTILSRYESTFHPFLNAAGALDVGKVAIDECGARLKAALL